MASSPAHSLTTYPKPATEPGALDGWGVRCTCGFTASHSLGERWARKDGLAHVAWALKAGK